jgi:type II secretory pathway component GspD/PulD (secretin)
MYVFITPHLVNSAESAGKIYKEKRDHIDDTMEKNLKKRTKEIPLYD